MRDNDKEIENGKPFKDEATKRPEKSAEADLEDQQMSVVDDWLAGKPVGHVPASVPPARPSQAELDALRRLDTAK